MASSISYLSVEEVFGNPNRYTALLNRCQIQTITLANNVTHLVFPDHGKFDFICLHLLNHTTQARCKAFTSGATFDWTPYSGLDVWTRIEVWKIPLLLLILQFACVALAWHAHLFTLLHLLGNPANTIASLLYTLAACQKRALLLRDTLSAIERSECDDTIKLDWKHYALILVSYDECGDCGDVAAFVLNAMKAIEKQPLSYRQVRREFRKLAADLAADRQTKSLLTIYALFIFIHAFGFAFYKTEMSDKASLQYPNGKWVNIEAHSIAYSALLLWLVPAVYFGSIIGVSQTDERIPEKLNDFRDRLEKVVSEINLPESSDPFPEVHSFPRHILLPGGDNESCCNNEAISRLILDTQERFRSAGIYSCNPGVISSKYALEHRPNLGTATRIGCHSVAWLLILSSATVSMEISREVPPVNNICRPLGELAAVLVWLSSYFADLAINKWTRTETRYKLTFQKDAVAGLAILALILVTQFGIFNRCSCYANSPDEIIATPLIAWIGNLLDDLFMKRWLPIIMLAIAFQIIVAAGVSWWYILAFRVYLQRSNDTSNFEPLWLIGRPLKALSGWLERLRTRTKELFRWKKGKKKDLESGNPEENVFELNQASYPESSRSSHELPQIAVERAAFITSTEFSWLHVEMD